LCFQGLCFANKAQFTSYTTTGENPLIVVHASPLFNKNLVGKDALNNIVAKTKNQNREIYYLYSNRSSEEGISGWYLEDKDPTDLLFSFQGENNLVNTSSEFTIAGGFLGSDNGFGCMTATIIDLISNHFAIKSESIKLNIHLSASYTYGPLGWNRTLHEMFRDNDKRDFLSFLMTTQPGHQVNSPARTIDGIIKMESLIIKEGAYPSGFLDFSNLFIRFDHHDWALAGVWPSFNGVTRSNISTKSGHRFSILFNGSEIGILGSGAKKIILNFID
jgi:hypothetical protein